MVKLFICFVFLSLSLPLLVSIKMKFYCEPCKKKNKKILK